MGTSSLEFLSMMTSTLLANWSAGINRLCEVSSANLPALTSPSPTIWHRTLLCAPTNTSAVFAAKRGFRPGFIGSPTIASGKTRGAEKSWSASMKNNYKPRRIRRLSILV